MAAWHATKRSGQSLIPCFRRTSLPVVAATVFSATVFSLAGISTAQAATLTVNSLEDTLAGTGGTCTLRGAVDAVNNGADDHGCVANTSVDPYGTNDTIVFADALAGQTVHFASTITLSQPLTLQGPSTAAANPAHRVTLQGGGSFTPTPGNFRLLDVINATSPLTVEDLNFTDGYVATGSFFAGAGAAIRSDGSAVTVTRCRFADNRASGWGGAIEANYGNVTVNNSAFSGNTAGEWGGAIDTNGNVTVSNSTFSDNAATGAGGAIYAGTANVSASTFSGNESTGNGGAIWAGTATVGNSTFSGNAASYRGGAIQAYGLTGRHLTLVNNTASDGAAVYAHTFANLADSLIVGSNTNAQCDGGAFTSVYNLVANMPGGVLTDDASCGATSNTSPILIASASPPITNVAQIVATTLADHGGPTQTLALPAGSPAIATADPTVGGTSQMLDPMALATGSVNWIDATADQRGEPRKAIGNGRDLGAYEANDLAILAPATLPDGTVNTAYTATTLNTSGGTAPYTYAVTSGSLPPGLTLSASGQLSGIPTAAGTTTFAVTVADSTSPIPLLTGRSYTVTISLQATAGTPIPLLGPWTLIVLAGLLGAMGWRARKKA